jgi:hypothetical protein
MAVAAYGFVRGTRDVDFVVKDALRDVQIRLRDRGIPSTLVSGDVAERDFPCLRGAVAGVPFDVMPALVPLDWEGGIDVPLGRGTYLRVVDLDGLIRLKLRAGGPKDLMDVAVLVLRHPERAEKTRELAVAYRVADLLDIWLDDPRIRAQAMAEPRRPASRRRPKR